MAFNRVAFKKHLKIFWTVTVSAPSLLKAKPVVVTSFAAHLPLLPLVLLLVSLEESGIMHRVAFVVDRGFHRIGLHGGVAVPFLLGLGCNKAQGFLFAQPMALHDILALPPKLQPATA